MARRGDKRSIQGFERTLGRLRRRWEGNIKIDLKEMDLQGVDWIGLIWLRIGTVSRILCTQ